MKVGSIVVRTEDDESLINLAVYGNKIPEKEPVPYTVRDIDASPSGVGIRLEEIVNPPMQYRQGIMECAFQARLFKEIQSPEEVNVGELMEETNLIPFFVGNGY